MSEQQSEYETDQDPHGVVRSVRYEAHGSIPPVAATYADEEPGVILLEIDHLGIDKELDIPAAKALRACLDEAIAEAEDEEYSPHQKPRVAPREQPGFLSAPWSAVGTDTLIAAAGTGAQEVKEMGYDPVAAAYSTCALLGALEEIADGHEEPQAKAQHALACAEGRGDE